MRGARSSQGRIRNVRQQQRRLEVPNLPRVGLYLRIPIGMQGLIVGQARGDVHIEGILHFQAKIAGSRNMRESACHALRQACAR
jgi:hypothetical protein